MDALLHGVLTSSQKDDHVNRMVVELDLANEVFSPQATNSIVEPERYLLSPSAVAINGKDRGAAPACAKVSQA